MIPFTVAEAAAVLGAAPPHLSSPDALILDVLIDSRAVRAGSLFVALAGERVDGHDFVAAAFDRGAVAAVTERVVTDAPDDCLVVDDAVLALGRVARHVVDRGKAAGLQVVAITGSQGKTSTKDLLAQILEAAGPTVAPYGNLNNELGVPLTASRIDADTRYLVAEMGARGVGHIAYLCRIAPPDVSVVLNVGQAHVGEFGDQLAIARAKGELVEALVPGGTAVLNADDPLVWAMRERTAARVLAFSAEGEPATPYAVWSSDIASDDLGRCRFLLHTKGTGAGVPEPVRLRLSGRHHVANAVAAAAAATALHLDLEPVAAALSAAELRSRSRMAIRERLDDVVLIDDAYNANPDSTQAALVTLAEIGRARRRRHPGARTWAVLGDMLELGETAAAEHRALGRRVVELGIDRLVAVGVFATELARGAEAAGFGADQLTVLADKSDAAARVVAALRRGDTVLVKASRGLALDTVAEQIWAAGPASEIPDQAPESEDPA